MTCGLHTAGRAEWCANGSPLGRWRGSLSPRWHSIQQIRGALQDAFDINSHCSELRRLGATAPLQTV